MSPDDAAALLAIDPAELETTARAFVRSVRARSHRGCKNLERAFEATLASYRAEHPEDATLDALFTRFVASAAFDARGTTEEERFWQFLSDERIGDESARNGDLLAATMRALLTADAGAVPLPAQVRRCPGGWLAVDEAGDAPRLFAAARGRAISGVVTSDVADILLGRATGDPRTREALAAMGLV